MRAGAAGACGGVGGAVAGRGGRAQAALVPDAVCARGAGRGAVRPGAARLFRRRARCADAAPAGRGRCALTSLPAFHRRVDHGRGRVFVAGRGVRPAAVRGPCHRPHSGARLGLWGARLPARRRAADVLAHLLAVRGDRRGVRGAGPAAGAAAGGLSGARLPCVMAPAGAGRC